MKKKKIYEGKILGLSLYDLTIQGRKVRREIIEHRGAAAMLAIDNDNKVILVKQHRYPHGNVLEIPAGTLEKRENPKKLIKMILSGKIIDSKTICAVFTYAAKKKLL